MSQVGKESNVRKHSTQFAAWIKRNLENNNNKNENETQPTEMGVEVWTILYKATQQHKTQPTRSF